LSNESCEGGSGRPATYNSNIIHWVSSCPFLSTNGLALLPFDPFGRLRADKLRLRLQRVIGWRSAHSRAR
ncbi:MAG: hypothetical protein PVH75_08635, partial [Syntrophobacterales bacterium]